MNGDQSPLSQEDCLKLTPLEEPRALLPFFEDVRPCGQCHARIIAIVDVDPPLACDTCGSMTPSPVDLLVGYHRCNYCGWRLCCSCNQTICIETALTLLNARDLTKEDSTPSARSKKQEHQGMSQLSSVTRHNVQASSSEQRDPVALNRMNLVDRAVLQHEIEQLRWENKRLRAAQAGSRKEERTDTQEPSDRVIAEGEDKDSCCSDGSRRKDMSIQGSPVRDCTLCREKQLEIEKLRRRVSRNSVQIERMEEELKEWEGAGTEASASSRADDKKACKEENKDEQMAIERQLDDLLKLSAAKTLDIERLESQVLNTREQMLMNESAAEKLIAELERDRDRLLVQTSEMYLPDINKVLTANVASQTYEERALCTIGSDGAPRKISMYEVISDKGVAYRRTYGNLDDRVDDILGPILGEKVAVQEVRGNWIHTLDGFWLPTVVDNTVVIVLVGDAVREQTFGDKVQDMWTRYRRA